MRKEEGHHGKIHGGGNRIHGRPKTKSEKNGELTRLEKAKAKGNAHYLGNVSIVTNGDTRPAIVPMGEREHLERGKEEGKDFQVTATTAGYTVTLQSFLGRSQGNEKEVPRVRGTSDSNGEKATEK